MFAVVLATVTVMWLQLSFYYYIVITVVRIKIYIDLLCDIAKYTIEREREVNY